MSRQKTLTRPTIRRSRQSKLLDQSQPQQHQEPEQPNPQPEPQSQPQQVADLLPPELQSQPVAGFSGNETQAETAALDQLEADLVADQSEVIGPAVVTDPSVVPKEIWIESVIKGFGYMSNFTRLVSIRINEDERASAVDAFGAIWETAYEVEALRPLIKPGNPWVMRAILVAAFTLPKVALIRAEIELIKVKRAEAEAELKKSADQPAAPMAA